MLNDLEKIFSLTRFFKERPKLPCWIAARFFSLDSQNYLLKSQGLSVFCESLKPIKKHREGSWVAVQCLSPLSFKKISGMDSDFISNENKKTSPLSSQKFYELLGESTKSYQTAIPLLLQNPSRDYREKGFSYQKKGVILQEWFAFLKLVEEFFISKGLAYAETPYLVKCPGTEPHLKALKSSFKSYYLPTSPEIQLKKLLCQDWTDFFEIKTCFREEENNETHQTEFHLLEWYRAFYSLEELRQELYELIIFLDQSFTKSKNSFKESQSLENPAYKAPEAEFVTVSELFDRHLQFPLSPQSSKQELFKLAKKRELPVREDFSFEDLFFSLFLNKIEPKLCQKTPLFISNYPPQLRAFSKINKEGWAHRFEFYWKGLELANAFYELTQFEEQERLFQDHLKQRKDTVPLDKELLSIMKEGMPPCSGVALGLDRLFLALTDQKNLQSTRLFPL